MVSSYISTNREDETLEAKARWYQSLSLDERMEVFCSYTELILAVQPDIVENRDAKSVTGCIRFLSTS